VVVYEVSRGVRGCLGCIVVSELAQVELRSGRVQAPAVRCPSSAASRHVNSSHWQPYSRAHCNTARCPPQAACAHVMSSHGQCCFRAHVPPLSSPTACPLVSLAPVRPQPLQHLQLPIPSGEGARILLMPRAVVLPKPLQHLQVPALSGECTTVSAAYVEVVPKAAVLPRSYQNRQVPAPSKGRAPAPTSAPPGAHPRRPVLGQSCSRAHFSTSSCPPEAAP